MGMRQSKSGFRCVALQARVQSRENLCNCFNIGVRHTVQEVLGDRLLMQFCGGKHSLDALCREARVVAASIDLGGDALDPAITRQIGDQLGHARWRVHDVFGQLAHA